LATLTATAYVDANLTNGQVYFYKVSAVSETGEGASTDVIGATPLSGAPPGGEDLTVIAILALGAIVAVAAATVILWRKRG